jgi:hypothetical protein
MNYEIGVSERKLYQRESCQLWSREFSKGTEVQSINGPSNQIEQNQGSSEANPLSIENVSCSRHDDVANSPAQKKIEAEHCWNLQQMEFSEMEGGSHFIANRSRLDDV